MAVVSHSVLQILCLPVKSRHTPLRIETGFCGHYILDTQDRLSYPSAVKKQRLINKLKEQILAELGRK
jgi:hypothetical protein